MRIGVPSVPGVPDDAPTSPQQGSSLLLRLAGHLAHPTTLPLAGGLAQGVRELHRFEHARLLGDTAGEPVCGSTGNGMVCVQTRGHAGLCGWEIAPVIDVGGPVNCRCTLVAVQLQPGYVATTEWAWGIPRTLQQLIAIADAEGRKLTEDERTEARAELRTRPVPS